MNYKKQVLSGSLYFFIGSVFAAVIAYLTKLTKLILVHNLSVGIIDIYFPQARFFTEPERFDRHLYKLKRDSNRDSIDMVSVCTPNYLHDAHIRIALRNGADAICEKPLVLNPWNLDQLEDIEKETGKNIYTVLQLRNHPSIKQLKSEFSSLSPSKKIDVNLEYITPRGNWYFNSWKVDEEKSGGVATNIGVHFFDMLSWIFGDVTTNEVHYKDDKKMSGFLGLDHANVNWYLSLDQNDLPSENKEGNKPYRLITVDNKELEFSSGFTDLHTEVYKQTLAGRGYRIQDARPSIEIVSTIRNEPVTNNSEHYNTNPFKDYFTK